MADFLLVRTSLSRQRGTDEAYNSEADNGPAAVLSKIEANIKQDKTARKRFMWRIGSFAINDVDSENLKPTPHELKAKHQSLRKISDLLRPSWSKESRQKRSSTSGSSSRMSLDEQFSLDLSERSLATFENPLSAHSIAQSVEEEEDE